MKLVIKRRDRELGQVEIEPTATLEELQQKFYAISRKVAPSRQRFTIPSQAVGRKQKAIEHYVPLSSYNLKDGEVLELKDLGLQLGWRTVFLIEYFGPLVLYPLFFMRPAFIYGPEAAAAPIQFTQWLALVLFCFHYVKREIETVFVHHWGKYATMPFFNVIKNSTYYWGAAAGIAYYINHPLYTSPAPIYVYSGAALFLVSEFLNMYTHLQLSWLRPKGSREHKIPTGILFYLVSCPNYTFEVLAWVGFNIMTSTLAGILFNIVGFAQMTVWALGKHRRYHADFKEYPRIRKAIIPFVL